MQRLARSIRDERRRGWSGHWSYDLNRHLALWQEYQAEGNKLHAVSADQNNGICSGNGQVKLSDRQGER